MAQRLVEIVCEECRTEYTISDRDVQLYKLPETFMELQSIAPERGNKDCRHCRGSGYSKRIVIAEVIPVDDRMCNAITNPETIAGDVERYVRTQHPTLKSLKQHGLDLIKNGVTDITAVKRVVNLAHSS